jgi:hypothetical protein
MSSAHWHLIASHAPLFGVGFALLLLLWGLVRGSEELKRVALGFCLLSALLVLPAYFTGQPAQRAMKTMTGYSPDVVDRHADVAGLSLAATLVAGGVAGAGLVAFRRGKTMPPLLVGAVVLTGLLAVLLMGWTSNLGGQVRHVEIRSAPQ